MNFKRYNESDNSWTDSHYIKGTDTDTITTLPAIIYPLAQTATVGLKGNTVQNGTPTPSAPIPVVGVGDLDNGQYKIPISSGGVTTNIYLGSTQTVRQIKKIVFDGTENWMGADTTASKYLNDIGNYKVESGITCMSSHYSGANNVVGGEPIPNNSVCFFRDRELRHLYLKGSEPITLANFKAYLAQQYANGTPVTLWYVLDIPTTGIVNEPLQKIGNYADSISGISIPTTAGANTLDVQTTLKPSEVTATFNGWHPVTSAHERENGAWT